MCCNEAVYQSQERRSQRVIDPVERRRKKLLEGDDSKDRYGAWSEVVPASNSHSRAGICQYKNKQTAGLLHLERKGQGKQPMVTVLHGT